MYLLIDNGMAQLMHLVCGDGLSGHSHAYWPHTQ